MTESLGARIAGCLITRAGEALVRVDPSGNLLGAAFIYCGIAGCVTVTVPVVIFVETVVRPIDWVMGNSRG